MSDDSFSRRYGHTKRKIIVREDAPKEFREGLLYEAGKCHLDSFEICRIICDKVRKHLPIDRPIAADEAINIAKDYLVNYCAWNKVYDICEAFYKKIPYDYSSCAREVLENQTIQKSSKNIPSYKEDFSKRINNLFEEQGIGWKMQNGKIVAREDDELEGQENEAITALKTHNLPTSLNEIKEARTCLSRRPEPDLTGAMQHIRAALECTARKISGRETETLGKIIKNCAETLGIPEDLREPLREICQNFASNYGAHLNEGKIPSRHEAELVLGISSVMITYILKRHTS